MFSEENLAIIKLNDGRLTLVLDVWFEGVDDVRYMIWDPATNSKEIFKPTFTELHFLVRTNGHDSTKCLSPNLVST